MLKAFLIEVLVAVVTMSAWGVFISFAYEWIPIDNIAGPLILASLVAFMVAGMVVHRVIEARRLASLGVRF